MERTLWFDRKFAFMLSIGVFPAVLERLRGTPARLEEKARQAPKELLTARKKGAWSIQEHIGHLFDLEPLGDGRIDDFLSGVETLRGADLTNKKTWEANHNAAGVEQLLASFRAAREHFVKRLEQAAETVGDRTAIHPRLQKPLRLIDMAVFIADHDDHHLASITAITREA